MAASVALNGVCDDEAAGGDQVPPRWRLLVLSPHLDDAVFSCAGVLAGSADAVVATAFAGRPPAGSALTEWDRRAGFVAGDDVVGARRREDAAALAVFGARAQWLDYPDSQYGSGPDHATLSAGVRDLLRQWAPMTVLFPLGLFHADHVRLHEAVLSVLRVTPPRCGWFVYADALYRRIPGLLAQRLTECRRQGLHLRRWRFAEADAATARKQHAVACYRSQLRALSSPGRPGCADLARPEAYWRVAVTGRGQT